MTTACPIINPVLRLTPDLTDPRHGGAGEGSRAKHSPLITLADTTRASTLAALAGQSAASLPPAAPIPEPPPELIAQTPQPAADQPAPLPQPPSPPPAPGGAIPTIFDRIPAATRDNLIHSFSLAHIPLLELAVLHDITLLDLIAFFDDPRTKYIIDNLERLARRRTQFNQALNQTIAVDGLRTIVESYLHAERNELVAPNLAAKVDRHRFQETTRRACGQLLRKLHDPAAAPNTPRKKKRDEPSEPEPPSSSPPKSSDDQIPGRGFTTPANSKSSSSPSPATLVNSPPPHPVSPAPPPNPHPARNGKLGA